MYLPCHYSFASMRAAMALQSSLTEVEWRRCDFTRKSNIGEAVLVCCVCGMCVSVEGEREGRGLFRHVHEVTLANTTAESRDKSILYRKAGNFVRLLKYCMAGKYTTAESILYRYFVKLLKLWHLVEVTLAGWTYML